MKEEFTRSAMLLGSEGIRRLADSHVALFGLGGVGSYAAEALVRAGVGRITAVDSDTGWECIKRRPLRSARGI